MRIYLMRHGETTGDIEDRYGGEYDDHLSKKGERQSKELANKLKYKGIQIIYHSPKIRATESAQIVSQILNVKLKIVDGLRERNNYGILTGLTKSEAKQKYPEEVRKLQKGKAYIHNVKNSEDYESFKERVTKDFEKIVNNDRYDTIAIISHGGPVKCIVREILRLGEFKHLGDCAILEIEKEDRKLTLVRLDNASLERSFA